MIQNWSGVEHEAFFSTAAQVIPVLVVLAVLENRLFKRTRLRGAIWWVLGVFATGEAVAFMALWWDFKHMGAAGVIVGATMGLGALFVLLAHDEVALSRPGPEDDND